jgi:hypothetical protein
MVTLISDKYVVLWNDPGNVEFSAIKGNFSKTLRIVLFEPF